MWDRLGRMSTRSGGLPVFHTAEAIFSIHPPSEVNNQLVEYALEELNIALAALHLLDVVQEESRPRMHWGDSHR